MRLPSWILDYGRRFTPFLAARIARTDIRQIPETLRISKEDLDEQLRSTLTRLCDVFPNIDFNQSISMKHVLEAEFVLKRHLGFRLIRDQSTIADAGRGVFVDGGDVPEAGRVVAIYPGTIYDAWDSILLQSIGNHFVLRCQDGVTIDGNDRRLSRLVHRSCVRRDLSPNPSDTTWLTEHPFNFLNIGQYINSGSLSAHNVQYVDLDIRNWPFRLRKFLPYAVYSFSRQAPLRVVLLVSTRPIRSGEELLSAYISK